MKHLKIYENYTRLNDVPSINYSMGSDKYNLKYKKNDLVIFKSLNRLFKINHVNDNSTSQDYYLCNPFDETECGWVQEKEVRTPKKHELNDYNSKIDANKFNL